MVDNIRKPVPKNQRQLSIQQQDPLLENPNNAVTPLPQFQNNPNPATDKAYRGNEISLRGDTTKPFTVGIQDIDESIYYYFENVIRPRVYQNGAMIDIPIIYGNPERWKSVQKDGYYRDKNGKIMAPVIMFRRTGMEKNRSIGNKLDANNPINYAVAATGYQKSNIYSNFDILNNRKPVESYKVVVIPDYVNLTYDCVIWTYYIEQMNKIVESINYASDAYWGDPARFKFLARIDSFTNNETLNQGEERLIKTNFSVKLNGYIVPDSINKDLVAANKIYSKGKVTVNTEIEVTPAAPLRSSGAQSSGGTPEPPAPSFDADYQAVLDYATTQGYTLPSVGQQTLQNQLVVDLKDAGVWSKLDTFAVFATDGDSNFALIDWIRLTDYTAVNSPTFTTNKGFESNGTSSYVDTNFNLSTNSVNYSQNDVGLIFGISQMSALNLQRPFSSSNVDNFLSYRYDVGRFWVNASGYIEINPFPISINNQIIFGNRTDASNVNARITDLETPTTNTNSASISSSAVPSANMWLLRSKNTYWNSGNISSLFGLGSNLSTAEMDDFETAYYTNYFTNL